MPTSRAPLALLLLAGLLAGCGGCGPETPAPTPSLVVTTVSPVSQQMERTITVSGSVAAWQEMFLGVELTGIRVAEVLVEVGDTVRAGQPLLRLDTRTLEVQARQADASVAQARASLELARANADRGATLVKEGLISSSNADELRATLDQRRSPAGHRGGGPGGGAPAPRLRDAAGAGRRRHFRPLRAAGPDRVLRHGPAPPDPPGAARVARRADRGRPDPGEDRHAGGADEPQRRAHQGPGAGRLARRWIPKPARACSTRTCPRPATCAPACSPRARSCWAPRRPRCCPGSR